MYKLNIWLLALWLGARQSQPHPSPHPLHKETNIPRKGNCITEASVWKALLKITFQASICRCPAFYGQLFHGFSSFFTTDSMFSFLLKSFFLASYSTVRPLVFSLSPTWNAILSNKRGQTSSIAVGRSSRDTSKQRLRVYVWKGQMGDLQGFFTTSWVGLQHQ